MTTAPARPVPAPRVSHLSHMTNRLPTVAEAETHSDPEIVRRPFGGASAEGRFVLSHGDVVALSGDFFASHHCGAHGVQGTQVGPEGPTSDDLFRLAAIPGNRGTKLGAGTRSSNCPTTAKS